MVDNPEEDDVDIFVSPRRFGGRTPGAKETFKKVREEEEARKDAGKGGTDSTNRFEGVKYNFDPDRLEDGDIVHRTVGRNNTLRKVVLVANYLLAVVGIALVIVATWVLLQDRNSGVYSFLSRQGFILTSAIPYGVLLIAAAGGCILGGYFFGVPQVAPSLVEGLQGGSRRKSLALYQVLVAVSIVILSLIFFSALPPLQNTKGIGITGSAWRKMALSHPKRICEFEIQNKCAGDRELSCSDPETAGASKNCPGHFCADTCKATSTNPQTNVPRCESCFKSFSKATDLEECRAHESNSSQSRGCLDAMRSDVRTFFTVIVSSSGIAIGFLLIASILGTLSPILSAST